jgi:hypothetical protein
VVNDEQRFLDWRWAAGGSIAIVGTLVSLVLYLHTAIEEQRNTNQDTRITTIEADVRGIRDIATKISVMEVQMKVSDGKLDRVEAGLTKLTDRLESQPQAQQRDEKPPGKK